MWDVYGVCSDCDKYERMEKSSPGYIKWKKSPEYKNWENDHLSRETECQRVVKLDCQKVEFDRPGERSPE